MIKKNKKTKAVKDLVTLPTKEADTKGNFVLKNNLLTIRFWSQVYTTALFDKNILNYTLVCQYPLSNFNLDILKDVRAAQIYLDIEDKIYVARIAAFIANVSPDSIVMQLTITNLRLKEALDMEFNTPSMFYEQILAEKSFFKVAGKKLEDYIKPLGLARKVSETDQALRRRTLGYLALAMGEDNGEEVVNLINDLKKKKGY